MRQYVYDSIHTAPAANIDASGTLTYNQLDRIGSVVGVTDAAAVAVGGAAVLTGTVLMNQSQGDNQPYSRPSNATTPAQRASVQGQPGVDCGASGPMNANHIDPLVVQYYRDGAVDTARTRDLSAVNAQCPTCSAVQGAQLSRFSKFMRAILGQ